LIKSSNTNFIQIEKQQMNETPQPKPTIIDKPSPNIEQTHSDERGLISFLFLIKINILK
jgi:hypothetical protein